MSEPVVHVSHNNQSLNFTVSPQKLGGFISGLLGQPQEIKRAIHGNIDLNKNFFENIIIVLNHRITVQNEGELTFFRAKILYEDDFERTIDNLPSFISFSETRNSRSIAAKITITYLVHFANKASPEKQEISITVNEGFTAESVLDSHIDQSSNINGIIFYNISHTERSFGDDIASLLDRECEKVIEKPNWFIKNVGALSRYIAIITFLTFLCLPTYFESAQAETAYKNAIQFFEQESINKQITNQSINYKIDGLISFFKALHSPQKYQKLLQLSTFFVGIILGIIFLKIGSYKTPSFVTFGEFSEKYRENKMKKGNLIYVKFSGAFLLNILAGVIGSAIYTYLSINTN